MPAKAPVKSSSDRFWSAQFIKQRAVSLLNDEVANHCISLKNT